MNVTIVCNSPEETEYVYDLLTNPLSGTDVLSGAKICTNELNLVPDVMVFELTKQENIAVKQLPEVKYTGIDDTEVSYSNSYVKKEVVGKPSLAAFNSPNTSIPTALHYCQTYEPTYSNEFPFDGSTVSLSTIDCSNVDILIIDGGVDATHDDFKDELGNSRVVNFNWTQLRDNSTNPSIGQQIVSNQPGDYYQDPDGHGTACASLIAGNKCGFARNAKIYSLKSSDLLRSAGVPNSTGLGFTTEKCLQLAVQFQEAKLQNLFGLNSSRPTVFSNSWNSVGPVIARDLTSNLSLQDTLNLSNSIDRGPRTSGYNRLPGASSTNDGYIRTISQKQKIHTFISANNFNGRLSVTDILSCGCHFFRSTNTNDTNNYVVVRNSSNTTQFSTNQTYNNYVYPATSSQQTGTRYFYSSPNIGMDYNRNAFPVIIVGDVISIGDTRPDADLHFTAANSKTAFSVLSSLTNENRIVINNSTRYTTLSGPFFIKSAYSSFGPGVDIYAPGNGSWAALSNQARAGFISTKPQIQVSATEKYIFFDGTSAATPIAAGTFATFVSQYPTISPAAGREWMLTNSIPGNIMTTVKNTLPVNTIVSGVSQVLNIPFGSTIANNQSGVTDNPWNRLLKSGTSWSSTTATISDLLFSNRFFDSINRICQAFPLRRAIIKSSTTPRTIANTTLVRGNQTAKKVTHS